MLKMNEMFYSVLCLLDNNQYIYNIVFLSLQHSLKYSKLGDHCLIGSFIVKQNFLYVASAKASNSS
jgi:hypothetical protein